MASQSLDQTDQRENILDLSPGHVSQVCARTKAVANGALAWHVDNSVTARVNRCHYGISLSGPYDPMDKEHEGRSTRKDRYGSLIVSDMWNSILPKVSILSHGCESLTDGVMSREQK
jgi:hypothetical protein